MNQIFIKIIITITIEETDIFLKNVFFNTI